MAKKYFMYICISHLLYALLSVKWHLGCFQILAIVNSPAMNIGVHIYLLAFCFFFLKIILYCLCMRAQPLQFWPTLWDSMDCSLPGSCLHGILQAGILEGVAIPFSRGSSWPKYWTQGSGSACFVQVNFSTSESPGKPIWFWRYWPTDKQCCDNFQWRAKGFGLTYTCIHSPPNLFSLLRWCFLFFQIYVQEWNWWIIW